MLKNGGKLSRVIWSSFLSSKKMQNKVIQGFIYTLSRIWPTTTALTPVQRSCPSNRNSAKAACMEPVSYFNNSKEPFHNTPLTNFSQKIPSRQDRFQEFYYTKFNSIKSYGFLNESSTISYNQIYKYITEQLIDYPTPQ